MMMRLPRSALLLLTTAADAAAAARHPCVDPADGAALASCFGFNSTDSTDALHAAFSSGAARLTIDSVKGQPWLVRPLVLANVSGLHIALAAGVTVLAKRDEFHGLDDCLLRIANVNGVVVSGGPGSSLSMRRDDYAVPSRGSCPSCRPYRKAEWRMGIWLDASAHNVRLEKLHVTDSGGDGLFVYGAVNTTVVDCVFERHYRQGMSIISADGLLVERSTFADTNGTAPSAGIDVEPDKPGMQMKSVLLRGEATVLQFYYRSLLFTVFPWGTAFHYADIRPLLTDLTLRNNSGGGFMVNTGNFNSSTPDIDIEVTNMTVNGSAGVGIAIGNVVGVGGSIHISGSRVFNTAGCGLAIYRKGAGAAVLTLADVNFSQVGLGVVHPETSKPSGCAPAGPCAPLVVMGGWDPPYTVDVGGFSVTGGTIDDAFDRPFMVATDPGWSLVGARFDSINVNNPHGCRSSVQKNHSGVEVAVNCHSAAAVAVAASAAVSPVKADDDGSNAEHSSACTLPHGSCCGNATWSTFEWRAKASANAPFSITGATGTDGRAPALAAPPPGPPMQDLFTVCLSSKALGGCTNATAADTWSGWHTFTDTAARTLCTVYPNIDNNDPSVSLVLSVSVMGIPIGNMSTITLDIKPAGSRAHEPSYMIDTMVTPLRQMEDGGTRFQPAVRVLSPNYYLVLVLANNTVQPPVITGRANNQKYYNAMPSPANVAMPRTRRIRILQEYDARDNDVGAHLDAFTALVQRLGASAVKAAGDTAAMQQIAAASGALYIGGRLSAPCNHTRCKSDHSFPNVTTEQDVDAMIDSWARAYVDMMKGAGTNMSSLTQMEMYDEIG